MTKPISDYTMDELSAKIEAITAERERTANALKRYEEELERKKREVPLGVPCKGDYYLTAELKLGIGLSLKPESSRYNSFSSPESAQKHTEMLLTWRKALVANSKGEPIDIEVLLPLLKKGWVTMNKNKEWNWFSEKPYFDKNHSCWCPVSQISFIGGFNIKPAEDWRNSLMECGL